MLLTRQKIDWKFETFLMNNEMRPLITCEFDIFYSRIMCKNDRYFLKYILLKTLKQLKFINKAVEIPKPYNSSVKIHLFE